MSRAGSAFQRATSERLSENTPNRQEKPSRKSEERPFRRTGSFKEAGHAADRQDVPPLAIAMLVCGTRGDVQVG